MKALFAFIGMAVVILALIEINERRKAKKAKGEGLEDKNDCPPEKAEQGDCSGCGLMELCEREKKTGR